MRRLRKECPETKVLVLTRYDEEENMIIAKGPGGPTASFLKRLTVRTSSGEERLCGVVVLILI
jgi:DNA-binding NarL/FixJ family response regulator